MGKNFNAWGVQPRGVKLWVSISYQTQTVRLGKVLSRLLEAWQPCARARGERWPNYKPQMAPISVATTMFALTMSGKNLHGNDAARCELNVVFSDEFKKMYPVTKGHYVNESAYVLLWSGLLIWNASWFVGKTFLFVWRACWTNSRLNNCWRIISEHIVVKTMLYVRRSQKNSKELSLREIAWSTMNQTQTSFRPY